MSRIDCLTDRQKDVYLLREKGMSGPAIARQLGITQNAVYQHLHHIERRLKQYDVYQDAKERNLEPISVSLTRGDAKLIMRALAEYRRRIGSTVVQNIKVMTKMGVFGMKGYVGDTLAVEAEVKCVLGTKDKLGF